MSETLRAIASSSAKLGVLALAAALAVSGVDSLTRPRIATERANAAAVVLAAELDIARLAHGSIAEPRGAAIDVCADGIALRVLHGRADGYGGPIDVDVAVDGQMRVVGAGVAHHRETRPLADPVVEPGSAFLRAFIGRDGRVPGRFALARDGGDVDAVTGATLTSRAVLAGIATALSAAPPTPIECSR